MSAIKLLKGYMCEPHGPVEQLPPELFEIGGLGQSSLGFVTQR